MKTGKAFNAAALRIVSAREYSQKKASLLAERLTEEEKTQHAQYRKRKPAALHRVRMYQFFIVAQNTWLDDEGHEYLNGVGLGVDKAANGIAYVELSQELRDKINCAADDAFAACTDYTAECLVGALKPMAPGKR